MKKEELLQFCRLYHGEASIDDNPLDKSKDEFKWYMWRHEWNAVRLALKCKTLDESEELIKNEILASIEMFASEPLGGNASPFIDKYFSY